MLRIVFSRGFNVRLARKIIMFAAAGAAEELGRCAIKKLTGNKETEDVDSNESYESVFSPNTKCTQKELAQN